MKSIQSLFHWSSKPKHLLMALFAVSKTRKTVDTMENPRHSPNPPPTLPTKLSKLILATLTWFSTESSRKLTARNMLRFLSILGNCYMYGNMLLWSPSSNVLCSFATNRLHRPAVEYTDVFFSSFQQNFTITINLLTFAHAKIKYKTFKSGLKNLGSTFLGSNVSGESFGISNVH